MSKNVSLRATRLDGSQIVSSPKAVIGSGKLDIERRKLQTELTINNGRVLSAKTSDEPAQEVLLEIMGRPKVNCGKKTYQIKLL
jgi:hypothetical protein